MNVVKRDLLSSPFFLAARAALVGTERAAQAVDLPAQIPYQSLSLWHSHGLIIKSIVPRFSGRVVLSIFLFFLLETFFLSKISTFISTAPCC